MLIKKRILSILAVVLLLAVTVSAVVAKPPLDIQIKVLEYPGDTTAEPFEVSGPAVDYGLVCETGTVVDLEIITNAASGPYQILRVHKQFTCEDENGTFDIKMVVKLDVTTRDTTANWRIVSGTGQYANLKGHGSLIGYAQPSDPPSILDIYDGKVN